jgi:hypothetical protein
MADTAQTFGAKTADRSGTAAHTAYEGAKDAVLDGAHRAKGVAVEGHEALKQFTEESPHTAALLYIGIGFLFGLAIGLGARPAPRRW